MTTTASPFNWRQQPAAVDVTDLQELAMRYKPATETSNNPYRRLGSKSNLRRYRPEMKCPAGYYDERTA